MNIKSTEVLYSLDVLSPLFLVLSMPRPFPSRTLTCIEILRAHEEAPMGRYSHIRDMLDREPSCRQPSTSTTTSPPSPTNRPVPEHHRHPDPPVPLVPPPPSNPFPLLALPPELRERIYDAILLDSQPSTAWSWPGTTASPSDLALTLTSMRPIALTGTSRQLRKDVLEHIFRTTTFRIEILAAWGAGGNFRPHVYDRRVESVRWLRSLDVRGECGIRRLQVRMRTPDARGKCANVNLVWEIASSAAEGGETGRWSVEVMPDQEWPDSEEEGAEREKRPLQKRPGMPSVEMFNRWLRRVSCPQTVPQRLPLFHAQLIPSSSTATLEVSEGRDPGSQLGQYDRIVHHRRKLDARSLGGI